MPDVEALPAPTAPAPAVAGRRKWLVAEIAWTVLAWVAAIVIARVSFATESRSPVLLIALMGVMQALTFLWITMRFAKIIAELASRERRAEWATTELTAGEFVWRETKRPFLIMLLPAWSAFPLILGAVFYGCKLNSYAITLAVLCMPLAAAFATIFFLRRIYHCCTRSVNPLTRARFPTLPNCENSRARASRSHSCLRRDRGAVDPTAVHHRHHGRRIHGRHYGAHADRFALPSEGSLPA
jgi:hypothetical protein